MTDSIIRLLGVTKTYGSGEQATAALDDLRLRSRPGRLHLAHGAERIWEDQSV